MEWSVLIETQAPEGAGSLDPEDAGLDMLMSLLEDVSGIVGGGGSTWSATVTVETDWALPSAEIAHDLVREMASKAGLPDWPTIRIELVEADVLSKEIEKSNFPDIVGSGEVLEILGISKQYLGQLRAAGRFPEPIRELKRTPIWMRPAIEAFNASRRPVGRPSLSVSPGGQSPSNFRPGGGGIKVRALGAKTTVQRSGDHELITPKGGSHRSLKGK